MKNFLSGLTAVGLILAAANCWAGFSVEGSRLLDGNGEEFLIRGVNHGHIWHPERTEQALADIAAAGANAVRIALSNGGQWARNDGAEVANVIEQCKANSLICMLEVHDATGWGEDSNAVHISSAAEYWTSPDILKAITGEEDYVLINIANAPFGNGFGYGPPGSAVSGAPYVVDTIAAIQSLRDAGIAHTLVIDAPGLGGQGENSAQITAAIFMRDTGADPLDNLAFSVHMYDAFPDYNSVISYMHAFASSGVPLIVSEFGPERNGSPVDVDSIMWLAQYEFSFGFLSSPWSGSDCCTELDLVVDWNPDNLTPWGKRLFHGSSGSYGIARSAPQCASVFSSCHYAGSSGSTSSSGGQSGSSTSSSSSAGSASSSSSSSSSSSGSASSTSSSGGGGATECRVGDVTDWGAGFVLNDFVVTNAGSQPVSSWTVQLQFSQPVTVSNAWSIDLMSTGGSLLTGTNVGYNRTLQPGQSAHFGMQGAPGDLGTITCTAE